MGAAIATYATVRWVVRSGAQPPVASSVPTASGPGIPPPTSAPPQAAAAPKSPPPPPSREPSWATPVEARPLAAPTGPARTVVSAGTGYAKDVIDGAFAALAPDVERCHNFYFRDRQASGEIVVEVDSNDQGSAVDVRLVSSTMPGVGFADCVTSSLRALRLPPTDPGARVTTRYRYRLSR